MKKITPFLLTLLVLLILPSLAWAQDAAADAETPAAASRLIEYGIELVAMALGIVLIWGAQKLAGKFGVQLKQGQLDMIDSISDKAILYAEQMAIKKLKENNEKLKGPEKMELALNFGIAAAESANLPKKLSDKLEGFLEAKLAQKADEE